jgi:carbon storage regulator CsrA
LEGKTMLVLSRRREEEIRVGDAVITVLAIQGNRVRIGIEAPDDVHILRNEVPRYEPTSSMQLSTVEAVTQQPR